MFVSKMGRLKNAAQKRTEFITKSDTFIFISFLSFFEFMIEYKSYILVNGLNAIERGRLNSLDLILLFMGRKYKNIRTNNHPTIL